MNQPTILFWDGISALARPKDNLNENTKEWLDILIRNKSDLYITLLSNSNNSLSFSNGKSIFLCLSYKFNSWKFLIVHISKPISDTFFLTPLFSPLRTIFENNNYKKICISKNILNFINDSMLYFFKIKLKNLNFLTSDQIWISTISFNEINLNLRSFPFELTENDITLMINIYQTFNFDVSTNKFLKLKEKNLLFSSIYCIFEQMLKLNINNYNPHLIPVEIKIL